MEVWSPKVPQSNRRKDYVRLSAVTGAISSGEKKKLEPTHSRGWSLEQVRSSIKLESKAGWSLHVLKVGAYSNLELARS